MATKVEIALVKMESNLMYIKDTVDEIKTSVYGNGTKGLKDRVITLEVKMWIILILLFSIGACIFGLT